jgi:hypothetical protein
MLRHYWGEGSFLMKVFDPRSVDYYRARELSYAADYLDAQWVRLLAERDIFFFVAPSAILASLALVVLGWRLLPRALSDLSASARWLGLLVFLSNFVVLTTMGIYYRSTKPLVAPLLLGLLLLVLAEHRRPRLTPGAGFGVVFATALAMSLLDRVGLFYTLTTALALGLTFALTRRGAGLAAGSVAAVGAWLLYRSWLGPWLIHLTNGYWPDMEYQRLRLSQLLQPQPWEQAVNILGNWTSVALGGLPASVLLVGTALGAGAWAWSERRRPRLLLLAGAAFLAVVTAQVLMVAVMVERHDPLMWGANRLWYYPLAYQLVLVFALLVGAERLAIRGMFRRGLPIVFGAMVVGNVAHWPGLSLRMDSTPAFGEQKRRSTLLVRSLRRGSAEPLLDGDYRRFYFDSLDRFPRLTARAPAQVGEGAGVELAEVREGRPTAWARRESQIVPRTTRAGRHVLAGGVVLRPGDELLILHGATRPRLLAEVRNELSEEGPVFFRLEAELGAGRNDIRLVSRLRERRVVLGSKPSRAGFALLLPVAVWEPTGVDAEPDPTAPAPEKEAGSGSEAGE